jgi:paraquat-inducible protein B
MSKKANPTSIGLFFAVGIALGIAGLLVFSSRSYFHPKEKAIVYFNASLVGLDRGAPVKFRGVLVGRVVEILIRHNQASNDFSMPVIIAIDKKMAQAKSDEMLQIGEQASLDRLISQGFRARLDSDSLVTGVLYVSLDIVPDAPTPVYHQMTHEYLEIPTVGSPVQQLLADISHLDLRGLSEKLSRLVTRLDDSLSQLQFARINAGLTDLLASADGLVKSPDLTNSFANLRQALSQAETLLKRIDAKVDPLADSVTNTLADAQKTFAGLRVAVRNVADLVSPDSAVPPDLKQALEEFSNACRAVADLAEFLERNPNTLLTGKKQPKQPR